MLTCYPPVNELSNTMDLESTLIKAETLFRRFQRLVEAADKRHNFPGPLKKNTAAASGVDASSSAGPSSGNRRGGNASTAKDKAKDESQVITPELRKLLSRKVEVLLRTEVAQNGDGMPGQ